MTDYHISKETEEIRDAFLVSEFPYIEELIKTRGFADYYNKYKNENVDLLSKKLITLYTMMEEGKIEEGNEEKIELQMICCCLAIEDKIRDLILLKRKEIAESVKK